MILSKQNAGQIYRTEYYLFVPAENQVCMLNLKREADTVILPAAGKSDKGH